MRWTTHAIAVTLGLFVLAANTEPASAQQRDNGGKGGQSRRATHEEHDRVTNSAFSATVDEHGNAVVTAKVDDFILEKAVASTGDTTIRLMRGKDIVSIAMNHERYPAEGVRLILCLRMPLLVELVGDSFQIPGIRK